VPAYVVVNVDVTNPVRYQDYVRQVNASVEAYGGRYLVRAGRTEVLEGDYTPLRFVVVEFPDAARARSWWDSREYAPAKRIRHESARTDMFIVDGV
jgi:uncharacterized protein (DUF1330 family)